MLVDCQPMLVVGATRDMAYLSFGPPSTMREATSIGSISRSLRRGRPSAGACNRCAYIGHKTPARATAAEDSIIATPYGGVNGIQGLR